MVRGTNDHSRPSTSRVIRLGVALILLLAGGSFVTFLLLVGGCGKSGPGGSAGRQPGATKEPPSADEGRQPKQKTDSDQAVSRLADPTHQKEKVWRFSLKELNARLGAYLPPLDDGRLKAAPPEGWYAESRNKAYVTRFVLDRTHHAPLPRITILAEAATFKAPRALNEGNQLVFLKLVADSLGGATVAALKEPVRPMVIGSAPCVRYVVRVNLRLGKKTITADREVLKTLHGGRVYTVILDSNRGQLPKDRSKAYVVFAGLEFLTADADGEQDKSK